MKRTLASEIHATCSWDSPEEETRPEPVIFEGGESGLGECVADEPEPSARYGDEERGAVWILVGFRELVS